DVGADAEPLDDPAALVLQGHRPAEEPAVVAVGVAEAKLADERLPGPGGLLPPGQDAPLVVGVDGRTRAVAHRLLARQAGVVVPPLVAVVAGAVRLAGEDDARHRVREGPVAPLAEASRLLQSLAIRDVGEQAQNAQELAAVVEQRAVGDPAPDGG